MEKIMDEEEDFEFDWDMITDTICLENGKLYQRNDQEAMFEY
jgi:hypothetical protein